MTNTHRTVLAVVVFLGLRPALGGDWPQILGPNRDGRADGERLADRWGPSGPKVRWHRPVGAGYAGVAVSK
ncbi:MAG: alcohol dehydrogenase, partial [Pirellulales bacterium]